MKKAYLDDDVVSVIAKDDNGAESAALDLLTSDHSDSYQADLRVS